MAPSVAEKGVWQPAPANAKRSPCPVLNALANHGYLPRDGRQIHAEELHAALRQISVGPDIRYMLINSIYKVHSEKDPLGVREPGDVDGSGQPVLDLHQLGIAHSTEHNVSLTRQDRQLGDPYPLQAKQLEAFLKSSSDGINLAVADTGNFRKARYAQQKQHNADLSFTKDNHFLACSEASMIHCLFGKGPWYSTPLSYIKALFEDERLPIEEGWSPRWTPLFDVEMLMVLKRISTICWPFGEKSLSDILM